MKKKILFSMKSPYREQLDIIGYRFGHGKKALAIVGGYARKRGPADVCLQPYGAGS